MAEDTNLTPDAATGKGGKKKLLLILGVVLLLLLGGGAAAFFLLGGESEDEAADPAVVEEEEILGEPTYHELKPEFVVNLPPGGKAKMLQVALQVYTRDPELVPLLTKHEPMLRHHLFDVLSSQQADDLYTRAGRERLQTQLRDELVARLEGAGESAPKVQAVYFTQFVLQ
jgi:flagellar FliL protein